MLQCQQPSAPPLRPGPWPWLPGAWRRPWVKPPDNVSFVCKLNPVTQDGDLYTIFSRFGTVTLAEIIRDFKTGDSLCYAFIEFEAKEACERTYFKMCASSVVLQIT